MEITAQSIHSDATFKKRLEDMYFLRKIKLMSDSRSVIGELDKYIDLLLEAGAHTRIDNLICGFMKYQLGYTASLGLLCIADQCKKNLVSYDELSVYAKAQGKRLGLSDEDIQKDFSELEIK